jgi:hypothetical protein
MDFQRALAERERIAKPTNPLSIVQFIRALRGEMQGFRRDSSWYQLMPMFRSRALEHLRVARPQSSSVVGEGGLLPA